MTQIKQTSYGTGLGMNVIPVFTQSQAVDVSAADFVWQVDGSDPVISSHTPLPYEETETEGVPYYHPFKLKVSGACLLTVVLEGEEESSVQYFNEGENNQMVIKVLNNIKNTLTGATQGDIIAYK